MLAAFPPRLCPRCRCGTGLANISRYIPRMVDACLHERARFCRVHTCAHRNACGTTACRLGDATQFLCTHSKSVSMCRSYIERVCPCRHAGGKRAPETHRAYATKMVDWTMGSQGDLVKHLRSGGWLKTDRCIAAITAVDRKNYIAAFSDAWEAYEVRKIASGSEFALAWQAGRPNDVPAQMLPKCCHNPPRGQF